MTRLFVFILLSNLLACSPSTRTGFEGYSLSELRGHSYWVDPSQRELIDWSSALDRLQEAQVILIGERHDNPHHHLLQAEIIRRLDKSVDWVVGFEHISWSRQGQIDRYLAQKEKRLKELRDLLEWNSSGWPSWSLFRPIFAACIEFERSIWGLDLGHEQLKSFKEAGFNSIPGSTRELLKRPLQPHLAADLLSELRKSHPFIQNESVFEKMLLIQRARDATMADQIVKILSNKNSRVIGLMGLEHARNDRGVPWYIREAQEKTSIVSIGLWERDFVAEKTLMPQLDLKDRFDLLLVTPPRHPAEAYGNIKSSYAEARPL